MIKCDSCKSIIKKVKCGTLYCAKTNPIQKINLKPGDITPGWCPKVK